jgi:Methyltransferase FkbM domain
MAVETISLAAACGRFGTPTYIKLDIEGAEIEVIEASRQLLRQNPIHLAVDTNHWVHGKLTAAPVEALLGECGYEVLSSDECGIMTTWGKPR